MEDKLHAQNWITEAIAGWQKEGIKLQTGAAMDKIDKVEASVGFKFPPDFVAFYTVVNGFVDFDWNEHMFSLWSLERMIHEYSVEDNFVGFCDFLICSHTIGFDKVSGDICKSYSHATVAGSFSEFIGLLNTGDDVLY